jgi:hypothetical protein
VNTKSPMWATRPSKPSANILVIEASWPWNFLRNDSHPATLSMGLLALYSGYVWLHQVSPFRHKSKCKRVCQGTMLWAIHTASE